MADLVETRSGKIERNYGADLLRSFAMYLVAVLHVLGQGGVLSHCAKGTANNSFAWLLECFAYMAVDLFALTSGYVGYSSGDGVKISRMIILWLRTAFYTIGITAVFAFIIDPTFVDGELWVKVFSPVYSKVYWYITAYFGLLVVAPLLNVGIKHASPKSLIYFLVTSFVVCSVLPTVFESAAFGLGSGYSAIWLILLYAVGAAVRRLSLDGRLPALASVVILVIMTVCTWLSVRFGGRMFLKYISPTVVISAVCVFDLFLRIKIKRPFLRRVAEFLSDTSLSVYIIHVHPILWANYMKNAFVSVAKLPTWLMVLAVLGCAAGVYLACTLTDVIRYGLFDLLRLKKLFGRLDKAIDTFLEFVMRRRREKRAKLCSANAASDSADYGAEDALAEAKEEDEEEKDDKED